MPDSIFNDAVASALLAARTLQAKTVTLGNGSVDIVKPFPSPQDWRDVWIYQIMVDRFNNPGQRPNSRWDGEYNGFQGGTFTGILEQLDYLKGLGVGALWLSPVLKNPQRQDGTYHGYGIQDFLTVDPRFGTEAELIELIDQAHARGLYVIFDIVLNHCGDVFDYEGHGASAPWQDTEYPIRWRDEQNQPREDWHEAPAECHPDAAVFPDELRHNRFFRRKGKGGESGGDFESLKELITGFVERDDPRHGYYYPVRDILIRAHQYLVARFDVDGYRIDTLKYVSTDFARIFGNAMREFAQSIGKAHFFTYGEVWDSEEKIVRYIGRNAASPEDMIGVDAALDFPLFYNLPGCIKGFQSTQDMAGVFDERKRQHRNLLSSHGEASRYFVTFLDNHDQYSRFFHADPTGQYDAQLSLGVTLLFTLQGIPCLYYGTEQGLHGSGGSDKAVREALWGMPGAFDRANGFYQAVKRIAEQRAVLPALRYGRQYFRAISGNGIHFGISRFSPGVVAFSRILNDQELLIVANTGTTEHWNGHVIVDFALNAPGAAWQVLYSNQDNPVGPQAVSEKPGGEVWIDGTPTSGRVRYLTIDLRPMEVQILGG